MKKYEIIRGETGRIVGESDNLEEALDTARDLDNELSMVQWDNLENHFVQDTETGEEFFPEY